MEAGAHSPLTSGLETVIDSVVILEYSRRVRQREVIRDIQVNRILVAAAHHYGRQDFPLLVQR